MASKELQKLLEGIRAAGSFDGDLMTMRKMMSRAPAYPKPEDITWEPVDAAGVPAEWVIPDDCVPGRAVVYLHGGGYATGTLDSARPLFSHLARATRASLLAVDYRLAPEHPFPAAVDDAVTAYRFAISAGHAPEAIALCGDSSGGGLALGNPRRAPRPRRADARDCDLPQPLDRPDPVGDEPPGEPRHGSDGQRRNPRPHGRCVPR